MKRINIYQTDADADLTDRVRKALVKRSKGGETERDWGTSKLFRFALRRLARELGVE